MVIRKLELKEKGWNEPQIRQAAAVLEKSEKQSVYFSRMVFWSALLVIIFANLLVSLLLIPFLIVFSNIFLYVIISVLALVIGFLYNFLITDIGHLERTHHLLAGIIVPILALANLLITVSISNGFITDLKIGTPVHSPWIAGAVFALVFIVPYVVDRARLRFATAVS